MNKIIDHNIPHSNPTIHGRSPRKGNDYRLRYIIVRGCFTVGTRFCNHLCSWDINGWC